MPANIDLVATPPADPIAKSATLYEQIGSTAAVVKTNAFAIALPTGASEGAIDPLPDSGE